MSLNDCQLLGGSRVTTQAERVAAAAVPRPEDFKGFGPELVELRRQADGWPPDTVKNKPGVNSDHPAGDRSLRRRLLTRAQLADLPQPAPLIEDTLDKRTVAVLSGRRAKGKSLLALDWALCVATGKPWQGRPTHTAPVLWVAAEGAFGLHQRVSAWEYAWSRTVDPGRFITVPYAVNLYTGRDVDDLTAYARELRPGLVVFDTWARCTVGGSENDNSDATISMERFEPFRHLGATTLVIAHTDAVDTKTRGATALEDNADTVYRIAGDERHLTLKRTKRKDGPEPDEVHLKLRPTLDSVVIESVGAVDMTGRTADLMSIFSAHFLDTGATKKELRDVAAENSITSSGTFTRAVNALVRAGTIVNTGSDTRPYYKLGGQP